MVRQRPDVFKSLQASHTPASCISSPKHSERFREWGGCFTGIHACGTCSTIVFYPCSLRSILDWWCCSTLPEFYWRSRWHRPFEKQRRHWVSAIPAGGVPQGTWGHIWIGTMQITLRRSCCMRRQNRQTAISRPLHSVSRRQISMLCMWLLFRKSQLPMPTVSRSERIFAQNYAKFHSSDHCEHAGGVSKG